MSFPWVSRRAYELLEKRLEESEAERRKLLDQVLTANGMSPMHTPLPLPTEAAEIEELLDKSTGAINIPKVIAMAEQKKREEYRLRSK